MALGRPEIEWGRLVAAGTLVLALAYLISQRSPRPRASTDPTSVPAPADAPEARGPLPLWRLLRRR